MQPAAPARSAGFRSLFAIIAILGIALPWSLWAIFREPAPSSFELAEQALDHLEANRLKSANELALKLLQEQFKDPDIGGSLEYIVGVVHYRKAEMLRTETERQASAITEPVYELAIKYLEQARRKTFKAELYTDWAYTLGACYFELGKLYQARELLEQVYPAAGPRQADILLKLSACYLDPNILQSSLIREEDAGEALAVRQKMLQRIEQLLTDNHETDTGEANTDETDRLPLSEFETAQLKLCQAEFLLRERKFPEMAAVLESLNLSEKNEALRYESLQLLQDQQAILQARSTLEQQRPEDARQFLQPLLSATSGLVQHEILQAHYLAGLAYAQENRYDLALKHLEKAALVQESPVSFPACFQIGELARQQGFHEDALKAYLRGIGQLKSRENFTNRLFSLSQARQMLQAAWDAWTSSGRAEHFRFATTLAEQSVPLLTQAEANRLSALTNRKQAELAQQEMDLQQPFPNKEQQLQTTELWQQAGSAYARLAHSMQASEAYGTCLWEAALLYRRGYDFENALKMVQKYLETNPRTGTPAGLILKARLLLDLAPYQETDLLQTASETLQLLIRDYPRDQMIYEAQVLLGEVYLEQGQTELAVQNWRDLLLNSPLTPEASEWQTALFLLGRTLFLESEPYPTSPLQNLADTDSAAQTQEAPAREAVRLLEEFVRRNPQHSKILEARWLLAKGLKSHMLLPAGRLATAETENTRLQLLQEILETGQRALDQYHRLHQELTVLEQQGLLDPLGSQLLRDSYFEPAHIQFALGKYDSTQDAYRQAIELYSNAAFHFAGDPVVMIAYYRIAECYRLLGAEEEARRQIEQAKIILEQMPRFAEPSTSFDREQWQNFLDQSLTLYNYSLSPE